MLSLANILFQPSAFDVFDVYRPDDPCVASIGRDRLRQIYHTKYQVAAAVRPDRILEIGVRAGYAAAAFLAARPAARYVGLDKDDGSHGGVPGYSGDAATALRDRYPDVWVEVYLWDSAAEPVRRRLRAHHRAACDLVHVDGDHTESGCAADLALAAKLLRPGGYLLVDDYDLLPDVRRFSTAVFDLVDLPADGRAGVPGKEQALYYYRPWKTLLVRAVADGGTSCYIRGDHRRTIPALWQHLVAEFRQVSPIVST